MAAAAPPPVALTIAGSDPSGGAGVQADLKTFHRFGVFGTSAITLLTVQNTRGVSRVEVLDAALVGEQIDAVLADLPPAAAKTGALGSAAVVGAVAARAARFAFPLVVDPVLIAKGGQRLVDDAAYEAVLERLLPHAALVTPNLPEAAALAGLAELGDDAAAMERAARAIAARGARAVLVKGGHGGGDRAVDLLLHEDEVRLFEAPRVPGTARHGTGCTLSAAIVACLARGAALPDAVDEAKRFLTAAIASAPALGGGHGPVDHWAKASP